MSESSSCLSFAMKMLAAFCVLAFIVTLPFSLLAFFTSNVLFTPEELSGSLTESLIDSGHLRNVMTEFLSQSAFLDDLEPDDDVRLALRNLSENEWDHILDIIVPDEWLEKQIKEAVISINVWLDDDSPRPNIEIDLRPLKAKMQGEETNEIIDLIVDSWPSCTEEQIADMHRALEATGEAPILFCEPPEPYRTELVQFAVRQFRAFSREMPPTYSMADASEPGQDIDDILLAKERVRMIRAFTMGGWLLSAALLGLIMILAIRSWRDLAIWWGIPVLIVGALTIGLGLSIHTITTRFVLNSLADVAQETPAMYDMLIISLGVVRDRITENMFGAGILLLLIGLVLALVGWYFNRLTRTPSGGESVPGGSHDLATPQLPPDPGYLPPPPPVRPPPEDGEEGERPSGMFG